MIILGIESSCDETAAAVVKDGTHILSSVVSSQIKDHRPYGGVVPELASRKHMEAIVPVVESALSRAGVDLNNLDAIAATQGPGLIGALLIGFSFAKAFAYARKIPWVGVNHLEGHISSVFLEEETPEFPFVALMVSGGHTTLYLARDVGDYQTLATTVDDAAGEAFEKVAWILGLDYPGGPSVSRLAEQGDPKAFRFPRYRPKLRHGETGPRPLGFSFSGLKTSVVTYLEKAKESGELPPRADVSASIQEAIVDVIVANIWMAFLLYGASRSPSIDAKMGADTTAISKLIENMSELEKRMVKIPSTADLMVLMGVGFGALALSHTGADAIAPRIEAHAPAQGNRERDHQR